jgi:hypothetical protein
VAKEDARFIAAWNAWRREQGMATRARLLGVAGEAAEAVREAVRRGDGRLALTLLKEMKLLTPEAPGADDPEVVKKEMALKRREREAKMAQREEDVEDAVMFGVPLGEVGGGKRKKGKG